MSARFVCSCFRMSMSAHSPSGDRGPWSTTALLASVRESPSRARAMTKTDPCSSAR